MNAGLLSPDPERVGRPSADVDRQEAILFERIFA
jgi:hypothetical protein